MKKLFLSLALCCAFALCCAPAGAAERGQAGKPGNAVDQLTGALWQQATDVEKLSFLLGVESAITVERFVNDRLEERSAQAGKPPVSTLSPFEKGWMTAFRDTSRTDIAKLVDEWYAAHPDRLDRSVMAVIWQEIIHPRLRATK